MGVAEQQLSKVKSALSLSMTLVGVIWGKDGIS